MIAPTPANKLPTGRLTAICAPAGFLRRLAANTAGNVIIIAAAALFPLLALIGSGIDMGRGYLAETPAAASL